MHFIHCLNKTKSCFNCILVLVNVILHIKHLKVRIESVFSHSVKMKISLIFFDLFKVFFDVVKHLKCHSIISLSQMRVAHFIFIPKALHIVNIQTLRTFFAEKGHDIFSLFKFVNFNKLARGDSVKVTIS